MQANVGSKRKFVVPSRTKPHGTAKKGKYDKHGEAASLSGAGKTTVLDGTGEEKLQRANWNRYPSETLPTNFLTVPNQVDIKITSAPVDYIDELLFEFVISNPDTSNDMILVHPAYWLSRFEVMLNGGTPDEQMYDDNIYLDSMINVTDECRARDYALNYNPITYRGSNVAATSGGTGFAGSGSGAGLESRFDFRNYDEPYAGTTNQNYVIPAGATKLFYVKFNNLISRAKPLLSALSVQPRFRFYSGQQTLLTPFQTTVLQPVLQSLSILYYGVLFSPAIQSTLVTQYRNRVSTTKYCAHERQILNLSSVLPNVETSDQILTALNGKFAGLIVVARTHGVVGSDKYSRAYLSSQVAAAGPPVHPTPPYTEYFNSNGGATWKEAINVTLNDSNGNPIGYVKTLGSYLRGTIWNRHFKSTLQNEKSCFLFPFAMNCGEMFEHGKNSGSLMLDGAYTLRMTFGNVPAPTATTTENIIVSGGQNLDLLIFGLRYSEIRQVRQGGGTAFEFVKF